MSQSTNELRRQLRLFDAITLVVGSMIGSGIFFGLSIMAQWVQTPGFLIGLWVFGGLFTMLGAISYAELAAMYPHAGGLYVFLREAYGAFWAFLFGWTQFLVIQTGFNAAVAIAFAKYLGVLVPSLGEAHVLARFPWANDFPWPSKLTCLTACCTWNSTPPRWWPAPCDRALLTAVNIRGVREGAFVQNLFTVLKVVALVALIVAGLAHGGGSSHFFLPWSRPFPANAAIQAGFLAGLAVASPRPCLPTMPGIRSRSWPRKCMTPIARFPGPALGCMLVTVLYVLDEFRLPDRPARPRDRRCAGRTG